MKKIIVCLFFAWLFFSNSAIAANAENSMAEFKQKLTKHIDNEIGILTQFKSCLQTAQSRAALEVCKNNKNEAQEKKMLEMKREHLESQKKQLVAAEKSLNEAEKVNKK